MKALSSIKNRRTNPQPPSPATPGTPPPAPQPTRNPQNGSSLGQSSQNPAARQPLTLPQVIQLLDIRINNLENFVKDVKTDPANVLGLTVVSPPEETDQIGLSSSSTSHKKTISFQDEIENNQKIAASAMALNAGEILESVVETPNLQQMYDEFDKRYEMLAEEIIHIKNIVLNLQSYTMDVNKLLMEDKLQTIKDNTEQENLRSLNNSENDTDDDDNNDTNNKNK